MFTESLVLILTIQLTTGEQDQRVITSLKYSRFYVKPTVVNGLPASEGDLPFLVSIKEPVGKFREGKKFWLNLCGGSIISATKVLTAAHCFELNNYFHHKYFYRLRVVAGDLRTDISHSGNVTTTTQSQWREPSNVKLHNDFHFPANDIALIFISDPWIQSANVDLIPLARSTSDSMYNCVSAGYGKLGHGKKDVISSFLRVAPLHLMTRMQCSRLWEMPMDSFICTNSAFSDVSVGDSGGPLACKWNSRRINSKGNLLVGVVSGKNFDKTTLFTRVSAYTDWIDTDTAGGLRSNFLFGLFLLIFILM